MNARTIETPDDHRVVTCFFRTHDLILGPGAEGVDEVNFASHGDLYWCLKVYF